MKIYNLNGEVYPPEKRSTSKEIIKNRELPLVKPGEIQKA